MPHYVDLPEAARLLPQVSRVSVIGVSGAGKSTLAMRLSEGLNLRYVSLDRDVRWLPGWRVRDRAEQRRLHDGFVAGPRWLIDGTTVSLMDTRLKRSELILWLRMSRGTALKGIASRVATRYGRVRPDMAEGCPEQLPDLDFLRWIWTFERRVAPRIIGALDRYAPEAPTLVLQDRAQVALLLSLAQLDL